MFKTASKGAHVQVVLLLVFFLFYIFLIVSFFFYASALTEANKKSVFVCKFVCKLAISYHKAKTMESGIQL